MTTPSPFPDQSPVFRHRLGLHSAWGATAWYALATLIMTWPLVIGLPRDIPSDLGDPLLNCWILAWNLEHMLRFLGGDLSAFAGYWSANIYHPEPLALAYSEHLFAQSLQGLPIYAVSKNIILTYNLLFLSTFVLSGLGTYLLVRELTGNALAAFGAGLLYAFVPYRVAQVPHLQVLSAQWMPFVLVGFRRYFTTGRYRALAGGSAALVVQNLSCGYYLLFFAPFVAAYAMYELWMRSRLRDVRAWIALGVAAIFVVLLTLPFLLPYRELRALGNEPRSLEEVQSYSADLYSYFTTTPAVQLGGRIAQAFPHPEGELFPGVVPILLAGGFLLWRGKVRWRAARPAVPAPPLRAWIVRLLLAAAVVFTVMVMLMSLGHRAVYRLGGMRFSFRDLLRPAIAAAIAWLLFAALSPRARAYLARREESAVGFFGVALVAAAVLSLGPKLQAMGRTVGTGPYLWLYLYVPGYDGLRVPAREGMLFALFLSVIAGYALHELVRRRRHRLVGVLCVLFLIEATAVPLPVNGVWEEPGLAPSPPRVYPGDEAPPVYHAVRSLPEGTAVAELPFGPIGYELLAVFYSAFHQKPLVNGYSGGEPPGYLYRKAALQHTLRNPAEAWTALATARPSHVILHRWAYPPDQAGQLQQWLEGHGARRIGTYGRDLLYELPAWPNAPAGLGKAGLGKS